MKGKYWHLLLYIISVNRYVIVLVYMYVFFKYE